MQYVYDVAGHITGQTETGQKPQAFGYDALDRLTGITVGTGKDLQSTAYTYDTDGNRTALLPFVKGSTTKVDQEHAIAYGYAKTSNRLTTVGNKTYSYDGIGDLLSDGQHQWDYDARGRMADEHKGRGAAFGYGINGLGQRVSKQEFLDFDHDANKEPDHDLDDLFRITQGAVLYVYDQAGHLMGEYNSRGQALEETVWLGDLPVAVMSSEGFRNDTHYIAPDQLGAPHIITDARQRPVWAWYHQPFGENNPVDPVTFRTNGSGGIPVFLSSGFTYDLRFPGQIADAESGLNYNMARDYNPVIGRYVESDPIGLNGGMNTYGYVGNNPLWASDQSGLWYILVGGGGSFHLILVGKGSSFSFGFDSSGNLCVVGEVCNTFGLGVSGGTGLTGSVGSGGLCTGESHSGGVFVEGGAGVYGGGTLSTAVSGGGLVPEGGSQTPVPPSDQSTSFGRGIFGYGGGGSGGFIGCTQQTSCIKMPNLFGSK